MIPLSQPTKIVSHTNNKGVFEIEALYPGYGVTVGNSIRRVLLSSLEGAAITQVKIKGVTHEFSTLAGMTEDVITVLMNLKLLRFRMHSDEPQVAILKVKGEKEVTGADFKLPTQVELVNKEVHIATLTAKDAELEMEVQIEKGVGYVAAEARKKAKQEIGSLALDAIYTPVRKVSYKVADMRVGERTDFDRLTVEVETDGTITPETAFRRASDILVEQFQLVAEGVQEKEVEEPKAEKPKKKAVAKKAKAK